MESSNFKTGTWLSSLGAWFVTLAFSAIASIVFWEIIFKSEVGKIESAYGKFSIICHLITSPSHISGILFFTIPFIWKFKRLHWSETDPDKVLRPLFIFCALLICWILTGEKYNFYLDSWFLIDRVLLLLLCGAILLHPIFIPLFTSAAILFYSQYFAPFNWYYTYDIRPLFNVLLVGNCLVFAGWLGIRTRHLFIMIIVIQLSGYFYTAIAKFSISPNGLNWVTDNELFLLPLNAHLRGWMKFAGDNFYSTLTHFFINYGTIISALTLGLETICLFALANRKLLLGVLIGVNVMHVGIAFICGVVFWIWFCLNTAIIFVLFLTPSYGTFFTGKFRFLKSAVLVFAGILVFRPLFIAWYDSRYQWFTQLEVTCESGQRFSLDKNSLGGYSYIFVHDAVTNAIPVKLPGFNGYSAMWQEAMIFKNVTPDNVDSLRNITARSYYDSSGAARLNHFMNVYLSNYNKRIGNSSNSSWLRAPKQLFMSQPDLPLLPPGQRVSELNMWLKEYIYVSGRYHCIRRQKILQVNLK